MLHVDTHRSSNRCLIRQSDIVHSGSEETGVYYRLDRSNKRERPVYPAAAANTTILCVQIGALYIIILLHGVRQQVSTREKIKTSEGTGQCVMQYSNLNCLKNFIH